MGQLYFFLLVTFDREQSKMSNPYWKEEEEKKKLKKVRNKRRIMMIAIWGRASCSFFKVDQNFRGAYCLHHHHHPDDVLSTNL
jgi:hypothetical protein